MKKETRQRTVTILALAIITLLSGCGTEQGNCGNSLALGSWTRSASGETITFGPNCSFASDACVSTGVVPNITDASGTAIVTVDSSAGLSGCLSVGNHSCVYVINSLVSPEELSFSCDGRPAVIYEKQ